MAGGVRKLNKRFRGDQHERRIKKIYESAGWLVERSYGKPVYIQKINRVVIGKHDFFGCFDLIAIHPNGSIRLLQVTADTKINDRIEKMKQIPLPDYMKVLVVWRGRRKKKVYTEFDMSGNIIDEYDRNGMKHDGVIFSYQCAICKRIINTDRVDKMISIQETNIEHRIPVCDACYSKIMEV